METYSCVTNICINTIFSISLILFGYLLYVILKYSPLNLGGYKYLLLSNLILSNINTLNIFLFKPIFYVNCGTLIQATGIAKNLPKNFDSTYLSLEFSALILILLAFSNFISLFYRYQQMLPPGDQYWLNGTKTVKKIGLGLFGIFVIPNLLFLRLSRIDREVIEQEISKEIGFTSPIYDEYLLAYDGVRPQQQAFQFPIQPFIIVYSGKLNYFFYLFLIWVAISFFVLFIFFILFHLNIYYAMNETFQRYLEETYRGQKIVFTVFSIQMASYICLLLLPVFFAALSAIKVITLSSRMFELLIIIISFYTVFDALCVLYFIKAYRHFTFALFQQCLKFLKYKNYSKEFSWETSMKALG